MKKFIPREPGYYWYYSLNKEPIIIKVTIMPGREAWTVINGYGSKVANLLGRIDSRRIKDWTPPWDVLNFYSYKGI